MNVTKEIIVILAAGKGTRMKSDLPKVLFPLCNKPLISYVIEIAEKFSPDKIITVVGFKEELVKKELANYKVTFVTQKEQLGTGHALLQTKEIIGNQESNILVLLGDMPFVNPESLKKLMIAHKKENAEATLFTAILEEDQLNYGRIVRDKDENLKSIVEEKDASTEIRKIKEVNTGIYIFKGPQIFETLKEIKSDNKAKEYYLTDAIELLIKAGKKVQAISTNEPQEVYGINTPEQLARATHLINQRENGQP